MMISHAQGARLLLSPVPGVAAPDISGDYWRSFGSAACAASSALLTTYLFQPLVKLFYLITLLV